MKNYLAVFVIITLCCMCCKKSKDPGCGCNGKIVFTIKDSDEQVGYLYKNTSDANPNMPYYNYVISYTEAGCTNCEHHFFICNDIFLNDFGGIPEFPGIKVKFSGMVKNLCNPPFRPADITYNHIFLNKIEKQ